MPLRKRIQERRESGAEDEMASVHRKHHEDDGEQWQRLVPKLQHSELGSAGVDDRAHRHSLRNRQTRIDGGRAEGDAEGHAEERHPGHAPYTGRESLEREHRNVSCRICNLF